MSERLLFTQMASSEWHSVSMQRHVKDASASAYARNIDLMVCTGRHQACVQSAYRGAWASAICARVPSRQGMDCATVRIGIPVRYTSTFVVEESPEMQAWRITCQRLSASFAFPTAAPLPVPCQFLRSAANKAAAVLTTSRGPQSCIMKTMVRPECAVDMGADRLLRGLEVNGERRCRYGVDEKGVVGVTTRPLDRLLGCDGAAGCWLPCAGPWELHCM